MSYSEGILSLTGGSVTLTGAGTKWLQNVKPGDILCVGQMALVMYVAEVVSDTVITVSAPVPLEEGRIVGSLAYRVGFEFTPVIGAPVPGVYDSDVVELLNRAMLRIDMAMTKVTVGPLQMSFGRVPTNASPLETAVLRSGLSQDRSGALISAALPQRIMSRNAARRGFAIQNLSPGPLTLRAGTNANPGKVIAMLRPGVATLHGRTFQLQGSSYFETTQTSGEAVWITGDTPGQQFTAEEL